MDLIEYSQSVHRSLHPELKQLAPILSVDTTKKIHKIFPRNIGRVLEGDPKFDGVQFARALSKKKSDILSGSFDEIEWKFRQRWADGGEHFLLKEIMENGLLPSSIWPQLSSEEPTPLDKAFKLAKQLGYNVPDKFLKRTPVTDGEVKFFDAATYMAVTDRYACFRWGREETLFQQPWRESISTITGQFVIPDPLVDWDKCPFVADQLWIINEGKREARLIVVEVDGSHHLEPERIEEDRKRDLKFNALGYEVIRVNEAWCRVDPFRVVAEILCVTGLCTDFSGSMIGGYLPSLDDYVCAVCGDPMVRFEDDSIREVFSGQSAFLAHRSCYEQIVEEKNETGESQFEVTPDL